MKVNFDELKVYTDLAKTRGVVQNVRTDFANLIYTNGRGIEDHALALKIYNGNNDTEYNDHEISIIKNFSKICSPCVIDAFEMIFRDELITNAK